MQRTNGFDTNIDFEFFPVHSKKVVVRKIENSFYNQIEVLMNEFAKNDFQCENESPLMFRKNIIPNGILNTNFVEMDNPYFKKMPSKNDTKRSKSKEKL